ncbi:hypothetical protein E4U52_001105 [Claviceps spartinae]|nr:hypothetical protein E4U52_001105 [Claviceps spartinae]
MLGGSTTDIQHVRHTPAGYAIYPSSKTVRDRLLADDMKKEIVRLCEAQAVRLPERWYTYAVGNVPYTIKLGPTEFKHASELIEEEVLAQTGQRPACCRPSSHTVRLQFSG